MPGFPNLTEREAPVLWALGEVSKPHGEMCVSFSYIANTLCREDIPEIRRITRRLVRKGFAEFVRGLFNEDGQVCGSGHCITPMGLEALPKPSTQEAEAS